MDEIYKTIKLLQIENEKIKNLEMRNESLTNRIRILEEDFERLKKAQLQKFFEYTSEEQIDSTDSE